MSNPQDSRTHILELRASLNADLVGKGASVSFDQEVRHIWVSRKWTLTTWIFIANRYATLLNMIVLLLPDPNRILFRVHSFEQHTATALISCFSTRQVFTGLRAFALCNRSLPIFLVIFGLSIVPFFSNLVGYVKMTPLFLETSPGTLSCILHLPLSAPAILGSILADLIVLVVTWMKTAGTVRKASYLNIKVPLSELLIRDGTLYFLLNSIVISRFMLSLRQTSEQHTGALGSSVAQQSTVHFNSNVSDILVGNMGESLMLGEQEDDWEGADDVYEKGDDANRERTEESGRNDVEHSDDTPFPRILGLDIVQLPITYIVA
ncbi:hypothetical protein BDY19DRAFT_909879 [Irpex rosettiformis]|uniref:Uncharacterized protein n=1 Tax=Irpex rosettiformis TaxID=378272 RepID=A0ACB8TR08_9APHY|nr:hypothetical protein BDY19DRAFT_909879 [Irpex rosettiformis]